MATVNIPLQKADFKKLHLTRNDVLVLKRPKEMDDWEWNQQLLKFGEDIAYTVGFRVLIIGVDRKLSEILSLHEDQMERYGWVRRERVFAFKEEAYDHVANKYEELAREYHASMTEEKSDD